MISGSTFAQRYISPTTFTAVNTTTNVIYGNNISVLSGTPTPSNLIMDVYEPAGDVLTARPAIIILHTGSFLPAVANGQATGKRTDSAVVAMCVQFAKKGYVAVAVDYRLGWNPVSTNQDVRTGTLLNAVYRSVQDVKNCVRFLRNDAATTNTFKVDPNKIVVGGFGSGGYTALAVATLNKVSEITLNKFIDFNTLPLTPFPYVDQSVSGNFDGTNVTTLNNPTPSYSTFSSTVNLVFNIGGALGDTTWLEAGETPIISMQTSKDPFAPYKTGNVIVPTTGEFVVEASGSYEIAKRQKKLDANAIFNKLVFSDVYTTKANANSAGIPALYPFITPAPTGSLNCMGAGTAPQIEQGSPWDWWNEAVFIASYNAYSSTTNGAIVNCLKKTDNPDMSATKGRLYIDTIQGFLTPRIACVLGLVSTCQYVGVNENTADASNISIYPNPTSSDINFTISGGKTISTVKLFDATGRLVANVANVNATDYKLLNKNFNAGLYFAVIELSNKSVITKKVMID